MLACPACGTVNARPVSTGSTLEALTRAVRQRAARDFHEAEISYQQVLLQNPDEHEALWGRLLCRYGVEYVEDPATHRRLPTVHSVQRKPMQEQADFRDACEYAPPEIAARYRRDAAYIDHAQAEIRRLAETCPPYDVFLCHKTTKPGSGEKTDDFHRAYQLYHYLRDQGVRAFFAPDPNWTKIKQMELVTGEHRPIAVDWLAEYSVKISGPDVYFVRTRRNLKKIIGLGLALAISVMLSILNWHFFMSGTGWWDVPMRVGIWLVNAIILGVIVIGVLCHLIIKEHGHQYAHFPVVPGKRYRLEWQKQPSGKYRLVSEELDS